MVIEIPPYEPMSMVTPFTARDNVSYLQKVNGVKNKLNELIEWSNLTRQELIDKINADFDSLEIQWNSELTISREEHAAHVEAIKTDLIAQLGQVGTPAYNTIITAVGEVTDPATYALFTNPDTDTGEYLNKRLAPARARTDAAGELIQSRIDFGVSNIVLGIAGDSTGNDSNDWVMQWLNSFGPKHPEMRIEYAIWSDTLQQMQHSVKQVGTSTNAGGASFFVDTFTRTDPELIGDASDTGQVWALVAGSGTGTGAFSTNGAAAVAGGVAGIVAVPTNVTGDMTATANVSCDFTPPATSGKSMLLYSNLANVSNHFWLQFNISTTGAVTGHLYKRVANTATVIATATLTGFTPNAVNTFDMKIQVSGLTVSGTINGNVLTGNVSQAELNAMGGSVGISASVVNTGAKFNSIVADAPLSIVGQTLTVLNGSHPGSTLAYGVSRVNLMFPKKPDVVLINSGHNYGAAMGDSFIVAVEEYIAAVKAVHPSTLFIVSSQNPEFAPTAALNITRHAQRFGELRPHAISKGYGYVPVYEAFVSLADKGLSKNLDGIHPTTTGTNNGAGFWAGVWQTYLDTKTLRTDF